MISQTHENQEKELWSVLAHHKGIGNAYLTILFEKPDEPSRLIDPSIDEIDCEPAYPHPLAKFYRKYGRQILEPGQSVFLPYGASVPVIDDPIVTEEFNRRGIKVPSFALAGARDWYRLRPGRLTVGILTAGGNAPGINTVIDSIVKRHSLLATKAGAKQRGDGSICGVSFWGYRGGYTGLVESDRIPLHVRQTDEASLQPGSMLGIRRGLTPDQLAKQNSIAEREAQVQIAARLACGVSRDQLDILYVIGGNGTITGANALCEQLRVGKIFGRHHFPVRVVAAPKTMDNDVHFTDVTFGFRTTVQNAVDVIQRIHLEAETCGRIAVVELFGASSGFVALHASYASGEVDYVLIPEMIGTTAKEKERAIESATMRMAERFKSRGHALLVVAEGATVRLHTALGQFTHGSQEAKREAFDELVTCFRARLTTRLCKQMPHVFASQPKHLIRSTPADSSDVDLCKQTGKLMVDAALAGMGQCVVCLWHGRFVLVPMHLAAMQPKRVDISGYYFLSMVEKYLLDQKQNRKGRSR